MQHLAAKMISLAMQANNPAEFAVRAWGGAFEGSASAQLVSRLPQESSKSYGEFEAELLEEMYAAVIQKARVTRLQLQSQAAGHSGRTTERLEVGAAHPHSPVPDHVLGGNVADSTRSRDLHPPGAG